MYIRSIEYTRGAKNVIHFVDAKTFFVIFPDSVDTSRQDLA